MDTRRALSFRRFDHAELRFCRLLNRSTSHSLIRGLFRWVSRLGDGWLWYGLIATLPLLYGTDGWLAAAHMTVNGAAGVLIYKLIKRRAVRERPFITHSAIRCAAAPLDEFSFPSGHTLHAVSFTLTAVRYFPELAGPLGTFATFVALSRVVLGLHYPTDVAAGAILGATLAYASFALGAG
jgi:undecaprenyl-diphosphatase